MKVYLLGNWTENFENNAIEYNSIEEAQKVQLKENKKLIDDNRSQFCYELFNENMELIKVDIRIDELKELEY